MRHAQCCACEGTVIVLYWRSAVFWPLLVDKHDQYASFVIQLEPSEFLVVPGLSGGKLPAHTALLAIRFDFS